MNQKISVKEKLCYGIGSGGGNVVTQVLGTFLTAYYTDSVGIAAAAVGTMMLLARLLDGVSDIIMGGVIDKTKSRWGKARPWLLISAPLICVGLIATFHVPGAMGQNAKLVYAYLTYIFLNCISFTIYMISHTSMLSRMTLDMHDRQVMSSFNQIMNNVVQLVITGFTAAFVAMSSWEVVSVVYGLITAVMILICFLGTKEHLDLDEKTERVHVETVPMKIAVLALLKNKYFYLLALLFILVLGIASGHGSVTFFYCNVILENPAMMAPVSMALALPVILGNCFIPAITKKWGHQKTLILASLLMLIGFVIMSVGEAGAMKVIVGTVITGFGNGAIFACGFALSAQVVDYGEWKFHVRSEGLVNSCVSFGQKVGLGLGAAIASWIIAAGGYIGTAQVQTAAAKSSIVFAFGWFSVILAALLLAVSLCMNVDSYKEQMKADLEMQHRR